MVQVRPATEADRESVCALLVAHLEGAAPLEHYRRLFTYAWMKDKPDCGFVLVDEDRIVGYLGTVYADRTVDGRTERFCNLSSWCVLPGYRNHSLSLLHAVHRAKNQTFTNLSARPGVLKVLTALRYERLDTYKIFTPPLAQLPSLFRFPRPRICLDPSEIGPRLGPADLQLLRDHEPTSCGHLLLEEGGRSCYVIWNRRSKHSIAFCEILYVSDAELLRRHFEAVKLRILARGRCLLLAIDERLLGWRPRLAVPFKRIAMFKSGSVRREQIDNLYTELVLL